MSYRAFDNVLGIVHGVVNAPWRRGPVRIAPACETISKGVYFNMAGPSEAIITCMACLATIEGSPTEG